MEMLEAHAGNGIRTIGFEVGGSPFTAIDYDHCRDPESCIIEPWVTEDIRVLDSYTEVSPSGTGIRIFVTAGDGFASINRKKGGLGNDGNGAVEVANTAKYFSVTGHHLEGTPTHIGYRPKELKKVINQYFETKATEETERPTTPISLNDEEILNRAARAKNGASFKKLYSGDWSDYSSHSEADQALCCYLAFYTANDARRIGELFQGSGLYRSKWDRENYRTQTITRAIDLTKDTYKEKKAGPQAPFRPEVKLTFPDIMRGAAGDFAEAYSQITEAPKVFYYLAYLVCLGSYLSGKITLNTLLNVQSRLYVVLLGPSGRGRKSTPITITTEFFQDIFHDFSILHHANSGEGLGVHLEKNRNTLICYDEFLGFVSKAIQKGNTLLGTVTTLFEKNDYQTATKDKQLKIHDAHISMLGACTTDTWERCWEPDFTAIGLNNRLFLVPGVMQTYHSIPPRLDLEMWTKLRDEVRYVVRNAMAVKEYSLTRAAFEIYDTWYRESLDHKSIHAVRLDNYALRFMLLFAVNEAKSEIDVNTVESVIELVEWQHRVRQQYDPIDVDNESAKIETRIRRALASGSKTKRELQQRTAAARSGKWLWNNALQNLITDEEITYDTKRKIYTLVSG
ncbi:MAG: hypothetical protein PHT96_00975 [Syntrophorhabdaceae bacterium]|nr:hypothetical protein [Syntrophorhabdaceae bacterium]